MMMKFNQRAWMFFCGLSLGACTSQSSTELEGLESAPSNVTQVGAQDIGEFRRQLASGKVPESESLDPIGFFAEHAIDLPEPECGDSVCAHPMLAVAPKFDGGNWTMAFIGMNTKLFGADLPTRSRHFLLVVEQSGVTPIPEALSKAMAEAMKPGDLVSLIRVQGDPVQPAQPISRPSLPSGSEFALDAEALSSISSLGKVELKRASFEKHWEYDQAVDVALAEAEQLDLYWALDQALILSRDPRFEGMDQQALVFTSGRPSGGVTSVSQLEALGGIFADEDVFVSLFGVGEHFQRERAQVFVQSAGGNYAVSASEEDLLDAFEAAADSGFMKIARDLEVRISASEGYEIGKIYGASQVEVEGQVASFRSNALFIGARQGSNDTEMGRRGGGGGWFVELAAISAPGATPVEDAPVVEVNVSFVDALTNQPVEQNFQLSSPLGVGNNPEPEEPFFSPAISAKPFMMLNMYLALRGTLSYFEQGACDYAVGMQQMMDLSYALWQDQHEDADIADDYELLRQLTSAVSSQCGAESAVWPVAAEVSCFYF